MRVLLHLSSSTRCLLMTKRDRVISSLAPFQFYDICPSAYSKFQMISDNKVLPSLKPLMLGVSSAPVISKLG